MIADLRTGKNSAVPSSERLFPFWLNQNTLIAPNERGTNFVTFNLKTGKWTDLGPGNLSGIEHWMISPDYKYLYFSTEGAEPEVMRLRIPDHHQPERLSPCGDLRGNSDRRCPGRLSCFYAGHRLSGDLRSEREMALSRSHGLIWKIPGCQTIDSTAEGTPPNRRSRPRNSASAASRSSSSNSGHIRSVNTSSA